MEKLVKKSIRAENHERVDGRMLVLYITFNLLSYDAIDSVINDMYNYFVKPFEHGYIIDNYCNEREHVSTKRFVEKCKASIRKKGEFACANFGYDGVKKSNRISSLKSLENDNLEKIELGEYPKRIDNKDVTSTLEVEKTEEWFETIVNYNKEYFSTTANDIGLMFEVYKVNNKLFQGSCEFGINVQALEENIDNAAEMLKRILIDTCLKNPLSHGYVGIECGQHQFICDKQSYFSEYDEGLVVTDKYGKMDECSYMDLMYVDGLEWFNVIPKTIADRITDENSSNDSFVNASLSNLNDQICIIESKKSVSEHRQKDFAELFACFENCIRPGYSKWNIMELRPFGEDVYFLKNEYRIDGSNVYFERGNFDFITEKY